MASKSHEAGIHAERRYLRGLSSYRKWLRGLLALIMGPFVIAGLAGLVIEGHSLAWISGAVFGLGMGVSLTLWESPPAYIENWKFGAEGEWKTEQALAPLDRSAWLVLHDIENPRGNYDHIVVGRPGVFMLDTKNHQGAVRLSDGDLRLRRRLDPEADGSFRRIISGALANAAQLKEQLQNETGIKQWVQAVVVVWAEFDEDVFERDNCVVVHGSQLQEWLANRPPRLDEATVDELRTGVKALAAQSGRSRALA